VGRTFAGAARGIRKKRAQAITQRCRDSAFKNSKRRANTNIFSIFAKAKQQGIDDLTKNLHEDGADAVGDDDDEDEREHRK
jgi:hypothetical protein